MKTSVVDLAVIGGGIAGAGIARDAALRGLKVAVLEKDRVAAGTSSRSSGLIHGGVRYLETAWSDLLAGRSAEAWKNFRFVFKSLRESRVLAATAPSLVRPIALVIPFYRGRRGRSRVSIFLGCWLYYLLARLTGPARAPHFFRSADALLSELPGLRREGLLGGVRIWDHLTDDAGLVRAVMRSAVARGAELFEGAPVKAYRYDREKGLFEITAGGETPRAVYARRLVDATGPWVDRTRRLGHEWVKDILLPLAGAHLNFKRFTEASVILEARDRRLLFVISSDDRSRVGTTEREYADPDSVEPKPAEIAYLLDALNYYFPDKKFTAADIVSMDAAVRPLARPRHATSATNASREHEIRVGPTGVIHVLGVKLTDHRRAAEELVDSLVPFFRESRPEIKRRTVTHRAPL